MDSAQKAMIVALKSIRDQANTVLKKIEDASAQSSLSWKCAACGHMKHFTRPVVSEVAVPCPKCKGEAFDRV
jgi:hypothetical protein